MAKERKKLHPCGITGCPNRTINPVCPQCKQYVKHAAARPHKWRLEMRARYQRLDNRLARVDLGSKVVQIRRASHA